jgi:hypothetical protein
LLEELEHRADLVEFLPGEPVAVGDTWEVPLVAFHHISNPCGDVHLMTPTEREEGDDDDAMQDALRESLDGEIHATLERIEDGVAHIALTMELTMEGEVQGEDQETEEGVTLETFRSLEIELDLEGELQWVMESGRASNLVVAGEVALKQSQAQAGDHGGAVFRFEQIQHLTGTFEIKAAIE